jgi:predicted RNase H-like nuclease (RuvC/YqgF family)|nr:MAG TPA: nucleoporin [Caudoviricetes sp.]
MKALNKQVHQTENERMAQSLAERNGEPVEGLRQRISELEEIANDYGMKFQKAQDALKHQALLHKSQLEAAENNLIDSECHVAELEEALRDKQALLEVLDNSLCELLPGTQYMDPPDGGSVTPLEQVRRMVADYRNRIAELEARTFKPVMFIDGDISPADADKLASVIRGFNEETETPAARMARIIRENPHPTNMCDMPAAGIGVKGE